MSMVPAMTWKSTAVVSSATVLATWLASVPPSHAPAGTSTRADTAAGTTGTASDIEEQAARLHVKLRHEVAFSEPSRNLFRFTAPATRTSSAAPAAAVASVPEVPQAQPPLVYVRLSGVASDKVGDSEQRTVILSTPMGVVLAREGDEVIGQFKVVRIGESEVDLIRLDDGSPLHLEAR